MEEVGNGFFVQNDDLVDKHKNPDANNSYFNSVLLFGKFIRDLTYSAKRTSISNRKYLLLFIKNVETKGDIDLQCSNTE